MLQGRKLINVSDIVLIMRLLNIESDELFKGVKQVVIGNKEYEQVIITDNENNVLASITDENIIEEDSCKVVMIRKKRN